VRMWSTLESLHLQQCPGARFNAWDDFFLIRKKQDESLTSLIARIEDSMSKIQQLRPKDASNPYTMKDLDNELICMAMVRSLGDEYSHFVSSLLLFQSLEKDRLKEAFLVEELQHMQRHEATTASEAVLFASGSTCKYPPSVSCSFCKYSNHCVHKCQNLVKAKSNYLSQKSKRTKKGGNATNQASDASSSSQPPAESSSSSQSASQAMEFTGNASLRSFDPSSPLYPLQLDADIYWNADTGATAHMTPHRHWICNYTPKCVPVKLADNKVVYSAGVGSVVFVPVIRGRKQRPVEFTNVLHVPDLRNNLLSVLYLCRSKGFLVSINTTQMAFRQPPGPVLFVANIANSNCAFLDGETAPLVEFASAATTIPLDLDLWHRRLAHHHLADVKALLHHNLVTGMAIDSKTAPDPICEPCLAGKMHANPFPSSSWRASRPLELVHSDVHDVGHLSMSGYRYWITFIDDYSRFRFVMPLKAKSQAFEAFKTFKTFAENQSERKIKILRDDKRGEYMSNAFIDFTTQCGILRQHTVRNRPQQNGVAERANRLLSEQITATLDESGLAKAFWGDCLASLVHVWNRCPTEAVKDATPYELWHGCKPDVSHL